MKKKKGKIWRVNIVVLYYHEDLKRFRPLLTAIQENLAKIYEIEYRRVYDHCTCVADDLSLYEDPNNTHDLFYFRSTSETPFSAKEFRDLLNGIFRKFCLLHNCWIEVFPQNRTGLRLFPFPD